MERRGAAGQLRGPAAFFCEHAVQRPVQTVATSARRSFRLPGCCVLAVVIAVLAGCSAGSTASQQRLTSTSPGATPTMPSASPGPTAIGAASGIEGIAEADPQCPIASPGGACPPEPVSRTVAVLAADGREIARFTSATDGSFRVALPPGTYTLEEVVAQPGEPPSLKPVAVTVPLDAFVHVVLLFDTGIR